MNITVERLPECKAQLRVEIPADDVAAERQEIFKAYAKQAKIPGFRPGKVPTAVIEKRYADNIASELEERFVRQSLQKATTDEKIEVLNVTEVVDAKLNDDGTYSFTAELLVAPDFEVPEYKGLEAQVPIIDVTDEHLNQQFEQMRERFADYTDIEDRAAQMGDFAVISYKAMIDGKPLGEVSPSAPATLAQNTGFWLRMTEEAFLPGFCVDLVGAKPGDIKDVNITIPEDFPDESLRGQVVDYSVEITELKDQVLPPIDDDFADKIDPGKTLEEVKVKLREQMTEHREGQKKEMITNQILDKLNASVDFELPKEIVARETQNRVDDIVNSNAERGLPEDEIVKHQEEIIQAAGEQAALSVKTNYILDKVADAEGIKVEREEVLAHVAQVAAQQGTPPKKLYKQIEKNNGFGRIFSGLRFQKTIEFLREQAVVTEVEAPETPPA